MTVLSFCVRNPQAELPPSFHGAERLVKAHVRSADETCRTSDLYANTGELSDEAREELIGVYARLMEECVSKAHGPLRAFWLIEAQSWRERRENLIRSRSADFVRSLEIRRGLI